MEACDSMREAETLRNHSSKYLIKEIENNLNQLQSNISKSQTIAEVQASLAEIKPTSWNKIFVK
jgi:hypothetical protein